MWSDNESERDYLNYTETADLVVDVLGREDLRPLSVGVFGGWGAGKSSMVQLIETKLKEDEKVILISFDAWLFQSYDDARASLLDTIGSALKEAAKGDESLLEKVGGLLDRVDKLRALGIIAELGAAAVGLPAFGAISAGMSAVGNVAGGSGTEADKDAIKGTAQDIADRGQGLLRPQGLSSPPAEVRAFRQEFEDLLSIMDKTLVVVVDNLDRCLPRDTIHTLEAIRLFLFVPQTAFVIAADEEMIRHAVSEHYGAQQTRLVSDYLDKFVQVPVRVPKAGFAEVRSYLIMLLASAPFDSATALSRAHLDAINARLIDYLRTTWQSTKLELADLVTVAEAAGELSVGQKSIIANSYRLAETLAPLLANSQRVAGNPRIVKRMLNTVRLRSQIARARKMPLGEGVIAKLVLFERCASLKANSALLNYIASAGDGRVEEIAKIEEARANGDTPDLPPEWKDETDFVCEWAALEPALGSVDLRPAAYLARDTAPTKSVSLDLSPLAESALGVLGKATKASSPTLKAALGTLPPDERLAVQEQLIKQLGQVSDWSKSPPGFAGVYALAEKSQPAADALEEFIAQHVPKHPGWLSLRLKNASWRKVS
jgi:predicted KAP-like P-loop ATPase